MRILVIENNLEDQHFVKQSLRDVDGYSCDLEFCQTLSESLKRLSQATFDVILMELSLSDCDGLETCRRILRAAGEIPVVVLTGNSDRSLASAAIHGGAQDYLVKGEFPGSIMTRILQIAIDRSHLQHELARRTNYFNELISHVPAIIWTTDSTLLLTNAMGAGLRSFNLESREIIGSTVHDLCRDHDASDDVIAAHLSALAGRSMSVETAWRSKYLEVRIDPMRDLGNRIMGTVGVALDVTERREKGLEIDVARLIQQSLLPHEIPQVAGFDIFGAAFPAKQTCGDWFDYLIFNDGSIGLAVGDVSSKGYGPAIMGSTIAAYAKVLSESQSDIQELLTCCNRLICRRSLEGQFAVFSLARLQPGVRTVTYCGAGDGMLVVGRNGQLKYQLAPSGFPFGVDNESSYDTPSQVSLESGDVLLLLTDGFRETLDLNNKMFGESRIVNLVAANLDSSAREILESLHQSVREYSHNQNQQDDMTGIVVKVLDADQELSAPQSRAGSKAP